MYLYAKAPIITIIFFLDERNEFIMYTKTTKKSPFGIDLIPKDDMQRVTELHKYNIINTSSESKFNDLTELAAEICDVPIAVISFTDLNTVFYKSAYGAKELENTTTKRGNTICSIVVKKGIPLTFLDTSKSSCLQADPNSDDSPIRFYSGVPIKTKNNQVIGSLSVIDIKPRDSFDDSKVTMLNKLARVTMTILEQRLRYKQLNYSISENLALTTHDLRSPLNGIIGLTEIIKNEIQGSAVYDFLELISESADSMNQLIDKILNSEKNTFMELVIEEVNVSKVLDNVIQHNQISANKKGQEINYNIDKNLRVQGDIIRLREVFDNLINNAVKFSPINLGIIEVMAKREKSKIVITISDNGQGFSRDDLEYVFNKYIRLSSKPTGSETSNNLGLYITKNILDKHNALIEVESLGKGLGSTFTIKLPILNSKTS